MVLMTRSLREMAAILAAIITVLKREVLPTDVIHYVFLASDGVDKYDGWYNNGKATCTCRGHRTHKHCKHADYMVEQEQHNGDERTFCMYCGKPSKSGICFGCIL